MKEYELVRSAERNVLRKIPHIHNPIWHQPQTRFNIDTQQKINKKTKQQHQLKYNQPTLQPTPTSVKMRIDKDTNIDHVILCKFTV